MALTAAENELIAQHTEKLVYYRSKNKVRNEYYEGENCLKNLNIALPQSLRGLKTSLSWANIAVEALNERISLDGFTAPEGVDIEGIYKSNYLDLEATQAHREALIYGVCYGLAGAGNPAIGEPETLVTIESPNTTYGERNPRTRSLVTLLKITENKDGLEYGSLYLPNETIYFKYSQIPRAFVSPNGTAFSAVATETGRDVHNLGFVPAVTFINKPRASKRGGTSEITNSIIDFTDKAVRTLTNAEVASELFAAPQKYLLNADLTQFKTADGAPIKEWDAYLGKMLLAGQNKNGSSPVIGQFTPSSPEPYLKMLEYYTREIVKETGIPAATLGLNTGNPSSAEAISKEEARLVKRAEDRTDSFGVAWVQLIKYALIIRDGKLPAGADLIRVDWRDASTPTKAATADAATKLVKAGVLDPNSEVTWKFLGFTESQKVTLREEKAAKMKEGLIANISTLAQAKREENAKLAEKGNPVNE